MRSFLEVVSIARLLLRRRTRRGLFLYSQGELIRTVRLVIPVATRVVALHVGEDAELAVGRTQ